MVAALGGAGFYFGAFPRVSDMGAPIALTAGLSPLLS